MQGKRKRVVTEARRGREIKNRQPREDEVSGNLSMTKL